ncbi:hypothetical protein EYF80_057344 [Liparis tanakae]|uniref:Uncharacterized protein n=1 Tax=Liparis tanakae TaxID=230148 RepID=A0A4Z2EVV7_9TELE|nr:hypothetical protein EYF80_057344 [Liparis tanakae]
MNRGYLLSRRHASSALRLYLLAASRSCSLGLVLSLKTRTVHVLHGPFLDLTRSFRARPTPPVLKRKAYDSNASFLQMATEI